MGLTPEAIAHLKHILIVIIGAGALVGALAIRSKVEAYKVDRMAKRDEVIAENQVKAANEQKGSQIAQDSITARDLQNARDIATLKAELAQKLNTAQAQALIGQAVPGQTAVTGKDAQGNEIIGIANTQAGRDALNNAIVGAQICDKNLLTCEADKANLNQIIGHKNAELAADQSTMDLQAKNIQQLTKNQVPRWTAMLGVGKTQGSSFQDVNSYQPFLGLDYRLTNRLGIFGAAQNKSAAAGISWHFGSVKRVGEKPKKVIANTHLTKRSN